MANIGPVVMQVAGDRFTDGTRINAILWVYRTSTAGDQVSITDPKTGSVLWEAVTDQSNTYLGVNLGVHGLHAPNGFRLNQISGGRVLVYLRED